MDNNQPISQPISDLEKERRQTQTHTGSGLVSLHPTVYRIIVALAAIFVIASWSFFGVGGYTGLILVVMSLIVFFIMAVPGDLARIWRRHHDLAEDPGAPVGSFRHWLHDDVAIERYHLHGREAAIAALLPIAAGAVAMVLLALIHGLEISG